jgi:hypothetical protein
MSRPNSAFFNQSTALVLYIQFDSKQEGARGPAGSAIGLSAMLGK